jgi:DNA primase
MAPSRLGGGPMQTQAKQPKFDTDRLYDIPIEDVLEALGAERIGNTKKFRCFNKAAHKSDDKSASMSVHPKENYCNCFGCNTGGNPISLVTAKYGGDFYAACEWLHDTFRIPYLDESVNATPRSLKSPKKEPEYLSFDGKRPFNTIILDEWIPHYNQLNDERKLKLIYTAIYRFSLATDQRPKVTYHAGRGIDPSHPMLKSVGYLSNSDIKRLGSYLSQTFPKEDLVRFNLFSPLDNEFYPGTWKYWSRTGFCVAPSMDLYSDMCNGFMLRNTDANLDKKKPKEFQVSRPDISLPLPFGLTRELLLSDPLIPIYVNEGYIDGLSLGHEKLFIAATGVHGLKEQTFGLLKGREIRLPMTWMLQGSVQPEVLIPSQ